MSGMSLVEAIIWSLRDRRGFDAAFDLDDEVMDEIKEEMLATIDAHLARETVKVSDESLLNTCVGWVAAVACNGSLAAAAQEDIRKSFAATLTVGAKCAQCEACAPYLKEGETPAERIERERRDCDGVLELLRQERLKNEAMLSAAPEAAGVDGGEVRLWDTQWMTIINHEYCYRDWSKEDAVAHAIKMTEQAIARNVADGKLPPHKAPQSVAKGGE